MLTLKKEGNKWLPKSVSDLENYLKQFMVPIPHYEEKECRGLQKNIAYSLQHLEFIHRCGEDLNLTSVLWNQNAKTFIIVACSIIEALFFTYFAHAVKLQLLHGNPIASYQGRSLKMLMGRRKKLIWKFLKRLIQKFTKK